jgi:predicted dehydrogenase
MAEHYPQSQSASASASQSSPPQTPAEGGDGLNRRQFVGGLAATGVGLSLSAVPRPTWAQSKDKQTVNLGIVGVGRQGKILLNNALQYMKGVNFVAVCDIWSYGQRMGMGLCKSNGHDPNLYDNVEEMAAKEAGNLDGVFVAVPDIHHAHVTNTLLKAGVNVYCEKEMATNLEEAASMVKTARDTGKLLQIGHQRRSNPYYLHARTLMHKDQFAGQVTAVAGQWNQIKPLRPLPTALAKKYALPKDTLKKYGFENMAQFYYWRWFAETSGGPMADLGSHQVDVYNWFLESVPSVISAVGGKQWAVKDAKERDAGYVPTQLDHTITTYQYHDTPFGPVNGTYQVLLSSSKGGFFEQFLGDGGTIQTAERQSNAGMFKEQVAEELAWEDEAEKVSAEGGGEKYKFDPLKSRKKKGKMDDEAMAMKAEMERVDKAAHLPHQDNFVEAIRGNEKVNCPPEVGYETAVTALKSHEAALTGKSIQLSESDYKV